MIPNTHKDSPLDQLLSDLNPEQKRAVMHENGPLLIVAGAGTGKTTVLAKRIANLIISKMALPNEILALTFTDKAANEMEERVDKLVPYGFNDVWVSTFHSFGDSIFREHALDIGFSPDARVLTLPEANVFIRQNLFKFNLNYYRPLSDPTRFIDALLTSFSRAKDEEIAPEDFIKSAESFLKKAKTDEEKEQGKKNLEAAKAYAIYEDLKNKNGFIDFGDQVVLTLKIFKTRPSILKKYQNRFKYILVDEFQDTNYAQFEILKLLAAPHENITVVGDDDQSIYKFRGACLSNILGFRKTYPKTEEIVLQENYRSTQEILDSAYKLIQHNNPDRLEYHDKISKFLHAQKKKGKRVQYLPFDTLFSESEFIASEIKKRIESLQFEPRDFAILVRTNNTADPFIKSLNLAGIPWRFSGNAGLYEQEEIKTALSFLRVLDQPSDSASLYYLAVSPIYNIDNEDGSALTEMTGKTKKSLYDIFKLTISDQVHSVGHSALDAASGTFDCPQKPPDSRFHGNDTALFNQQHQNGDENKKEILKISPESRKLIHTLISDLKKYRNLASKMPTGNLLYNFFEEKGVIKKLAESNDLKSVQEAQNLHRFFEIIKKFSQTTLYDRVHYFIEVLDSLRIAGEDPASSEASLDENAVNILTVHAAKGLEFSVVFLAGLEQGHFPVVSKGDSIEIPNDLVKDILPSGDSHIQEERRLFYVGMTRAKNELIFCSAKDHGKKKVWKMSQFVLESLDKPEISETVIKTNPVDSLRIYSNHKEVFLRKEIAKMETDFKLSIQATAIEEYLNCPLKYKFVHVLKIPVLIHHTAVFGIALHEALKNYHIARKEKKKMSLNQFLAIFKNAWRSEGFISRQHEERRFQEGIRILKPYYKREEKSEIFPELVEESFKMSLGIARIRGRIDRIDIGEKSEIIDYKTGEIRNQQDADKKARESSQLILYSIAFKNRFKKLPDRASLRFIKNNITGTVVPTEEKIVKIEEVIQKITEGILKESFNPNPGYQCRWCAYEKICPAIAKETA